LLKSNYHEDITRVTYKRKLRIFNKSNIFPVAISRWLKECAEKSIILQNKNISLIPNCIDVNVFKAYDKMLTRNELNIPLNKKVIPFGAIKYLSDPRKGFNYLVDALQNIKDKTNYYLITFGDSNEKVLKKLGFEYKNFGFVNDDNYLSKI